MAKTANILYSLLSANASVTAIVGTAIYPNTIAQRQQRPCLVYQLVSTTPYNTAGANGSAKLTQYRVQVTCISRTKTQCDNLADAVVAALDYQVNLTVAGTKIDNIKYIGEFDNYDNNSDQDGLYIVELDFFICTKI